MQEQQPLVVAVSRSGVSAAAMPSPVTPIDAAAAAAASQLLLHPAGAPGLMASCPSASVASSSGARPQLSVGSVLPTGMLPLGVVVTADLAASKVRHVSPEIAKLQQSG